MEIDKDFKIKIKKGEGITYALKRLVEEMPNGQNIAFEGGMSKMFKITHVSSDEAIITLTNDIAIRKEMMGFVSAYTTKGNGLMEFTLSPNPNSVQLVATKPGKLKLVNGQWKLTEPIQTTNSR